MFSHFIQTIKDVQLQGKRLPFYLYSAVNQQNIAYITVTNPTLIFILNGYKELHSNEIILCHSGEFIFLTEQQFSIVRNIPQQSEYLAFIIEFELDDFTGIPAGQCNDIPYVQGKMSNELQEELEQLVEISIWAPDAILAHRRHEILILLYHLGYKNIAALGKQYSFSTRVHNMFIQNRFENMAVEKICKSFFMSESTLRRKLRKEQRTIKEIKTNAQLSYGLYLLQTTTASVQQIAEQCGYQTHSRFTANFKYRFGLTPRELRKTKS